MRRLPRHHCVLVDNQVRVLTTQEARPVDAQSLEDIDQVVSFFGRFAVAANADHLPAESYDLARERGRERERW